MDRKAISNIPLHPTAAADSQYGLVERTGLLTRIRAYLPKGIVAISAPAGYGKTTLLRLLLREIPNSVWLPLNPADRDPAVLEERLQGLEEGYAFLLDDVHLLGDAPSLTLLAEAIKSRPQRWALSGRGIPQFLRRALHPLPILHITQRELAFTPEEVGLWLKSLGYTEKSLRQWYNLTRGWPLAIAALVRLSTQYAAPAFLEGSIEEFLDTTVFEQLWGELSPAVRHFLTITGVALECSSALAEFLWSRFAPPEFPPVWQVWQEVAQRHLFIEPGSKPDTWRYHALFRRFLHRQVQGKETIARALVQWYKTHGQFEEAVEQSLTDGLWDEAVDLLLNHQFNLIYQSKGKNRTETYRRWVLSLPQEVLRAHPLLLVQLGMWVGIYQSQEEGIALVEKGLAGIRARQNPALMRRAYLFLSRMFRSFGNVTEARQYVHHLLRLAESGEERRHAYLILADTYLLEGDLVAARRFYNLVQKQPSAEDDPFLEEHLRANLAVGVLAPMGFIRQAEGLLVASLPFNRQTPQLRYIYHQEWAALYAEIGDWERTREALEKMETTLAQEETTENAEADFWRHFLWLMYHIGAGNWQKAEEALNALAPLQKGYRRLLTAQAKAWLARRQGQPQKAMRLAKEELRHVADAYPLFRGLLALEWNIAATEAKEEADALHPDTLLLLRQRALPSLLRLRGLLAWRCHGRGEEEKARRHLRRILALLRRFPRLRPVLATRDAELAFQVWRTAMLLGEGEEEAIRALACQPRLEPLAELLNHPQTRVQCLAARALAATRREEAMPFLQKALTCQPQTSAHKCFKTALTELENLPPPILEVQFLGAFRVRRGGKEIPESAWQRPAVVRLFQYLVLHRGRPLPRERILEDLWPGQPPAQARHTFRRLLSWLHRVLEPTMRPKGPFRYLKVKWDVYTFDPEGRVHVDAEEFTRVVEETLRAEKPVGPPPLPETLLNALQAWAPPVSAAPYEDWWLRQAEAWQKVYVRGCLYVAQAYLARAAPHTAIEWAERALAEIPWLEEAYQIKMRALARLGYRAQALATYEEAQQTLRREMGVEPNAQTKWLAERLRRGEEI